jgi:hypothetical protein
MLLLLPSGEDVEAGRLSNAQLETVVYSMMRFQQTLPSGAMGRMAAHWS